MLSRRSITTLTIAALLASGAGAPARQAPSPLDELNRLEGSLPDGVQAVVTIRNAQAARRTPAGRALEAMLGESDRFAETGRAWRCLAETLRWTPEQAFDELLGRRVTIVARRVDQAEPGDWALIGEVSRAAEERLRMSLRPAPRSIVRGLTVLSVEDGAFELTIAGHGAPTGAAEPASTFMLAPAGSSHLLEEVITLLGKPAAANGGDWGAGAIDAAARPSAFAMIRRPWAEGAEPRLLAMTASLDPAGSGGFHLRFLLSGNDAGAPAFPAWSENLTLPLERDALVATVGVAGLSPLQQVGEMLGLPAVAPAADALDPMPGRRMALVVREEAGPPTLRRGDNAGPPLADVLGGPEHRAAGGLPVAPRGRRPLSITLAVEIPDLAGTIPRTDALAARLEAVLAEPAAQAVGQAIGRADRQAPAFDLGLPEQLVRRAPLEGPAAEAWRGVLGDEPELRWGYARARHADAKAAADPGWWIIGLEPGAGAQRAGVQTVEHARAALAQEAPAPAGRRRVSVGSIRPRAIERWLTAMDPALTPRIAPLRWIDSARWDSWLTNYGAVEGEITIRMHAPSTPR